MNEWLKPAIVFVVGLLVGIGGMYLVGVRPQSSSATYVDISRISGLTAANFDLLRGNSLVNRADLFVTLQGVIYEIKGNTITLINGNSKPIVVVVNESAPIFVQLTQQGDQISQLQELKLSDLKVNDVLDVFGQLTSDNQVIAQSVYRETPPPLPAQ